MEGRPVAGQPDDTAEDLADFLVGVGRAEQMIDGAARGRFGAVFHRRPGQECYDPPRPFVDPLLAGHAQHDRARSDLAQRFGERGLRGGEVVYEVEDDGPDIPQRADRPAAVYGSGGEPRQFLRAVVVAEQPLVRAVPLDELAAQAVGRLDLAERSVEAVEEPEGPRRALLGLGVPGDIGEGAGAETPARGVDGGLRQRGGERRLAPLRGLRRAEILGEPRQRHEPHVDQPRRTAEPPPQRQAGVTRRRDHRYRREVVAGLGPFDQRPEALEGWLPDGFEEDTGARPAVHGARRGGSAGVAAARA